MKTETNNPGSTTNQEKQGAALVIVMCVGGLLLLIGIAMSFMAGNAAYMSRKIHSQVRALAVAEAGVADMINKMTTNYSGWQDRKTNTASFGDGSFVASTLTDTNTGHVIITSTGTVGDDRRTTIVELLGTLWDLYDATYSAANAIVAGGNITLKSSAVTINGGIHSNGDIYEEGGNPEINGPVSCSGTNCEVTASGTNSTSSGAAPLTVPDYTPFDEGDPNWLSLAQSNGLYYGSSQAFGGVSLTPNNGVIYVNGDVSFGNNSSYVGTLIATGTITINNRLTHAPFNTNWPAMCAGVDVNLNNRNSYYGVIFAANDVNTDNNRTVNGTIIALNNVTVANRCTLNPLPYFPAWDPADTNTSPPSVIIGGWLR